MTLLAPIWLLVLVPLGLSLWLWPPPTRLLLALRWLSFALVVLTLAGLALRLPSRSGTVVVLADRSLSMPPGSPVAQKEAIDLIRGGMSGDDRLAVVSFGQEVAIEQAPGDRPFAGFSHEVGGNASNLARGLETALSLIPRGSPGRVLVLSDGRWTGVDPLPQASAALARDIGIDYRAMQRPAAGDLAVARIDAPSQVSTGEAYLLSGWVFAPTPMEISYVLERGGQVIGKGRRAVVSGLNRLTFRDRAVLTGNQGYTLTVLPADAKAPADSVPENNTARFLVGVSGPRPLLHVSDSEASGLARLLIRGGLAVRSARPDEVRWSLEELSRYSAVLLENLPADKIGHVGMETLATWVRETGAGLVMTGGRRSYGPGGYYKSPLEPILPVSMELRNEHRKLSLAIVVALDRSGSMAVPVAGGKVKMDLANLGAAQVLDILGPSDEFACLAVDTLVHTIAPLGPVTDKSSVRRKILGIQSMGGGIYVYEALAASAKMLLKAKAGTKHIILFSDANDSEEPGAYQSLLAQCEKAGITVSVIGLGTERDVDAALLRDVARRGKGRIFFTDQPAELPRLFAQDTFVVARNTFLDQPVKVQHTPGLTTLADEPFPSPANLAIGGYNLCYLRPEATLATVSVDEYKAPVTAAWQVGAGRVVCYTGEADGKHAGAITGWDRVGDYFTSLTRWAAGPANPLRDNLLLTQEVRDGVNRIQLHLDPDRKGEPFTGLPRLATLRSQRDEAPRTDRALLSWTGPDSLAIDLPLNGSETSLTTVAIPGQDPVTLPPVCLPYSPEHRPAQADRGLATLEKLGRATGGQERLDLPAIWQALPRQVQTIPIGRWLLLAAVALWLVEVLERRTGLFGGPVRRHRVETVEPAGAATPRAQPLPATTRTKSPAASPAPAAQTEASPVPPPAPAGDLAAALRQARQRARERTE